MAIVGRPVARHLDDGWTREVTRLHRLPLKLDDKVVAVLAAGIDNKLLSKNTTDKIKVGKQGMVYVYDMQGRVLHPDGSALARDDSNCPMLVQLLKEKDAAPVLSTTRVKARACTTRLCPTRAGSFAWSLIGGEIFKPISDLLTNASLLTLVCALIVGTMIFISARGIVRMLGGISAWPRLLPVAACKPTTKNVLCLTLPKSAVMNSALWQRACGGRRASGICWAKANTKPRPPSTPQKKRKSHRQAEDAARQAERA